MTNTDSSAPIDPTKETTVTAGELPHVVLAKAGIAIRDAWRETSNIQTESALTSYRRNEIGPGVVFALDILLKMAKEYEAATSKLTSTESTKHWFGYISHWFDKGTTGCPVCGLGADGKPMGYVCQRRDCPSAVTC